MDYNLPKPLKMKQFSTKNHGLRPSQTTQNEAFSAKRMDYNLPKGQTTQNEAIFNQKSWTEDLQTTQNEAFSAKSHGHLSKTTQNEAFSTKSHGLGPTQTTQNEAIFNQKSWTETFKMKHFQPTTYPKPHKMKHFQPKVMARTYPNYSK